MTGYLQNEEEFLLTCGQQLRPNERDILRESLAKVRLLPQREVNMHLMKQYKKHWLTKAHCKELTSEGRAQDLKIAFYAMVARQYILNNHKPLSSPEDLKDFDLPFDKNDCEAHQLGYLRGIDTLLEMGIIGENNKQIFLAVGAMLEGSGQMYATGGAPSKATIARIEIFHKRSQTKPRQPRKRSKEGSDEQTESNKMPKNGNVIDDDLYLDLDIFDAIFDEILENPELQV